jgi:hypothetical protein
MRASFNLILASIVVVGCLSGCGGTSDVGQAVPAQAGDRQFRGEIAGAGISGEATVVIHAVDSAHSHVPMVEARITTVSEVIALTGTADPDGTIRLAGSGWSASLSFGEAAGGESVDDSILHGQVFSPSGQAADLVAVDEATGTMDEYCSRSRPRTAGSAPGTSSASLMTTDAGGGGGGDSGSDSAVALQARLCAAALARAARARN